MFGDALRRIGVNRSATLIADCLSDFCVKKPKVVGNLSRGGDRRSARSRRWTSRDGDGWRDPVNAIRDRFLKLIKELSGVRRKTLDVSPLAFCIQGVQGQARLTTTAQTTYGNKLTVPQIQIDILEVMN